MKTLRPNTSSHEIRESVTLAVTARAQELRRAGADVISLSAGEPDFPTPAAIAEAGMRAIREGRTRYTPASGLPELREAAAAWIERSFGLRYEPAEVMVTAGVKSGLHMALCTIVEPGDRVLLPAPYWVSYPDLVRTAGGVPVVVPPAPETGFVHDAAQVLAAAREHGARGLVLNYPNNPSGAVPAEDQVRALVEAAREADLWIVSDEIYAGMVFDGRVHHSPARFAPERTLVLAGGTKSHSFTGWRIGFLAGDRDVVDAAGRLQSQVAGNPCTISQEAAIVMCRGDFDDELAARLAAFDERRRFVVERAARIDGVHLHEPHGAFYALMDVREPCARLGCDDVELAGRILEEALVAVVPGSAFALPGHVRLSYAAALETLAEALDRIAGFLEGVHAT